jgi:hydrogenase maturation protease
VSRTLVLGLGNTLRADDGLGSAVIDWLAQRPLPPDVVVLDAGTPGLELVLTLADYPRALIVDAAELHRAPGQWARLNRQQVEPADAGAGLSLHHAGLAEALALGEELGMLPAELIIIGIQPARLDWTPGLSPEAQAAVPQVGQAVLEAIWPKS